MTVAELRAKLSAIEATESIYEGITAADVPALEQLLADPEEWVAARAVFALSRVRNREAVEVLARTAADRRISVRVAVAAAVGQQPITLPDQALMHLLQDGDPGVRKFAVTAIKPQNGSAPRALVTRLASEDVPLVRERAAQSLRRIR